MPIPPIHADIRTDALVAGVESLGAATLRASSDATYVNAVVTNAHLAGSVRYPRAHWDRERAARVRVHRVDRAVVDALGSGPDEGVPEAIDPRTIPAIDAHVSALVWDAITLRDVTLVARPDARGLTFALRATADGDTVLEGEGGWRLRRADETDASRPGRHASALSVSLHGEDLGAGLAEVGLSGVLAEGSGTVTASLGWEGPVYTPALERTRGALSLDVERGRIVPFEPGPARLVGLFALQAFAAASRARLQRRHVRRARVRAHRRRRVAGRGSRRRVARAADRPGRRRRRRRHLRHRAPRVRSARHRAAEGQRRGADHRRDRRRGERRHRRAGRERVPEGDGGSTWTGSGSAATR